MSTPKGPSKEEKRAVFYEHNSVHKNEIKLFTDGSKSSNGVGCAVIHESDAYVTKLPDSASVFTAELTAVVGALDLIFHHEGKKFVIYSDSKSALNSLGKYNPFHPLIQKAQEWLFRISCRHKSVSFCWVPSHVGIRGNELADREAKQATIEADNVQRRIPHSDLRRPIRSYILKKWQEKWTSPLLLNNKKYRNIRDTIEPWLSSFHPIRRVEVVLTRLRIGHTRLTHSYILEGGSVPTCDHCDHLLSVEHILVHCPNYLQQRRKHRLSNKTIKEILDDEVDIDNLILFLKDIDLFYCL